MLFSTGAFCKRKEIGEYEMKYTTLSIRTPELDRGCQQRKPMEKKTGKDPSYGMGTTTL
jgi:hypothetical protein